jgi:DNA-binding transcriptional LysR family regulator
MLLLASLARTGGIRKAASDLRVPRSTISRRLRQLEVDAGAALVVRTARRFALTELGKALAERAAELETVMARSEDLLRRASAEPSGTLRVAVAPVLGEIVLPEILAEMLKRHPRLNVDARLSVEYVDLRRGDVDVALRASSLEDASDVFAVRLGTSTNGCYASKKYVASRGAPKTIADLADHECILVGQGRWKMKNETAIVSGRTRVDNYRVARALAARGAGIFWTAEIFARELVAKGDLVPVLESQWPKIPVWAVHAGGSPPPPKVRAFIDEARKVVAKALDA